MVRSHGSIRPTVAGSTDPDPRPTHAPSTRSAGEIASGAASNRWALPGVMLITQVVAGAAQHW
jgi:hypothetical protein